MAQWDLHALRAQFALVSQDVVMFNDSLAANIAMATPPDRERLERCVDAANLRELVASPAAGAGDRDRATTRPSSPAANASAWPSPARCTRTRRC